MIKNILKLILGKCVLIVNNQKIVFNGLKSSSLSKKLYDHLRMSQTNSALKKPCAIEPHSHHTYFSLILLFKDLLSKTAFMPGIETKFICDILNKTSNRANLKLNSSSLSLSEQLDFVRSIVANVDNIDLYEAMGFFSVPFEKFDTIFKIHWKEAANLHRPFILGEKKFVDSIVKLSLAEVYLLKLQFLELHVNFSRKQIRAVEFTENQYRNEYFYYKHDRYSHENLVVTFENDRHMDASIYHESIENSLKSMHQ